MELHQLRYFVAVAEEGGFCKAAVAMHVAQPSLSQQVKKLEDSLGTPLFDRLGRKTVLTEAGRALLPKAKRVLAEVREMSQPVPADSPDGKLSGKLTIGAIPTIAPYALPRVIRALVKQHPELEIEIREDVTDRLVPMLVDAEVDVCVLSPPIAHPLVEAETIGAEPLMVAVPKDHPWASKKSVPLSALDEEPMVVLHEEHCFGRQLATLCAGSKVCPSVRSVSAQLRTALELVAVGVGFTVVPAMCAAVPRSSQCAMVPLDGGKRGGVVREIALAWRKDRTRGRAALAFAQEITGLVRTGHAEPEKPRNVEERKRRR